MEISTDSQPHHNAIFKTSEDGHFDKVKANVTAVDGTASLKYGTFVLDTHVLHI